MKLLRTFPKVAFEFGLASWRWMGIREQTPRFATCFGDVFLESLDGWWFLDTVEGTLELRWTSAVTMYAELESPEGRASYLMDDLVRDARSRGLHLGEEDVYTFNPHPALGGELGVSGLGTMRFELAVNWAGQMHDQVLHSPGELRVPPMPDDGRGPGAPRVAAAWDEAWSHDETFDVPFEQYLATTTFATVAAPHDGGYRSLPSSQGREQDDTGHLPYAGQGYDGANGYATAAQDAPTGPAEPGPAAPWPGPEEPAPSWPGRTEATLPWSEPGRTPRPGDPYARETWPLDHDDQVRPSPTEPTWGSPTWGNTGQGWQQPAVAAGGGPQQAPPAFTAWDDLWGTAGPRTS